MSRILLWLSAWLVTVPAAAMTQHFEAPYDEAAWQVQAGGGECRLVQKIPFYGRAEFYQADGQPLAFRLYVNRLPERIAVAHILSVPPPWKHDARPRDLGRARLLASLNPLEFERALALRLLYELQEGMYPAIRYRDLADGRDQVEVLLSSLRIRDALPRFQRCVAGLIQLDFDILKEHVLHFETDSYLLDYRQRRILDRFIRDYRRMRGRGVERIVLGGHADERGTDRYNDRLSLRRALEVKKYLVRRGIPASRIEVHAYGERWPVRKGHDRRSWAANRRVTVWFARRPAALARRD